MAPDNQHANAEETKELPTREEVLRQRLIRMKRREQRLIGIRTVSRFIASSFLAVGIAGSILSDSPIPFIVFAIYGALFAVMTTLSPYIALVVPIKFLGKTKSPFAELSLGELRVEIQDSEDELDLLVISVESPQQRAEKLFKIHQKELKRYYDQTLSHTSLIFIVGVLSIAVSLSLVGLTIWLVAFRLRTDPTSAKIIVAALWGSDNAPCELCRRRVREHVPAEPESAHVIPRAFRSDTSRSLREPPDCED